MFLIGGAETFPKVFAGGVVELDAWRDQRTLLLEDASLAANAVEEMGRHQNPLQMLGRTVVRDVELHGEKLRPGQAVMFLYASANRDEREFDEPDTFDVRRQSPRVLTFGHGTHACLGIHVAKAEGRIGLTELLARAPEYELDLAGAVKHRTEFVQGYESLPVKLG